MGKSENANMLASWKVMVHDVETGELVHEEEKHNLIVDVGRHDALGDLFVSSFTREIFPYMGVWSGSTAAAGGDTALTTELTNTSDASYTARNLCTNTSSAALSSSDITADTSVSPYREKIILQTVYGTSTLNGTSFNEFGLFDSATFGAGRLFNHFVLGSAISKTSTLSVTVQVTIRM